MASKQVQLVGKNALTQSFDKANDIQLSSYRRWAGTNFKNHLLIQAPVATGTWLEDQPVQIRRIGNLPFS